MGLFEQATPPRAYHPDVSFPSLVYVFTISRGCMASDLYPVLNWCEEQFDHDWSCSAQMTTIYIGGEDNAFAFKMRWC